MLLGVWIYGLLCSPKNHVLAGVRIPQGKRHYSIWAWGMPRLAGSCYFKSYSLVGSSDEASVIVCWQSTGTQSWQGLPLLTASHSMPWDGDQSKPTASQLSYVWCLFAGMDSATTAAVYITDGTSISCQRWTCAMRCLTSCFIHRRMISVIKWKWPMSSVEGWQLQVLSI